MENDPLFKIIAIDALGNQITAAVSIAEDNEILKGHFPGQPVVPGACMLQLVQQMLKTSGLPYRLKKADYLKFMVMVTPTDEQVLQLKLTHKPLDGGGTSVVGSLVNNGAVCFKFQGVFVVE